MTQETKLTEPVQVGLWYETKAGAIVKIDKDISLPNCDYKGACFVANNGISYNENGINQFNDDDLIRCLGADPFKQDAVETKGVVSQKQADCRDNLLQSCGAFPERAVKWGDGTPDSIKMPKVDLPLYPFTPAYPFKQVDIPATETVKHYESPESLIKSSDIDKMYHPHFGFARQVKLSCILGSLASQENNNGYDGELMHKAAVYIEHLENTQFERIFTATLNGLLSNPQFSYTVTEAIEIAQEAIKQLKEIEGA